MQQIWCWFCYEFLFNWIVKGWLYYLCLYFYAREGWNCYIQHTHTHHAQWTQPMQLAVLVRLSHAILHAEFSWAASMNMETRKMFLAHFIIKITNKLLFTPCVKLDNVQTLWTDQNISIHQEDSSSIHPVEFFT